MSSRIVTKRPLCDLTNKFAWPAAPLRPAADKSLSNLAIRPPLPT